MPTIGRIHTLSLSSPAVATAGRGAAALAGRLAGRPMAATLIQRRPIGQAALGAGNLSRFLRRALSPRVGGRPLRFLRRPEMIFFRRRLRLEESILSDAPHALRRGASSSLTAVAALSADVAAHREPSRRRQDAAHEATRIPGPLRPPSAERVVSLGDVRRIDSPDGSGDRPTHPRTLRGDYAKASARQSASRETERGTIFGSTDFAAHVAERASWGALSAEVEFQNAPFVAAQSVSPATRAVLRGAFRGSWNPRSLGRVIRREGSGVRPASVVAWYSRRMWGAPRARASYAESKEPRGSAMRRAFAMTAPRDVFVLSGAENAGSDERLVSRSDAGRGVAASASIVRSLARTREMSPSLRAGQAERARARVLAARAEHFAASHRVSRLRFGNNLIGSRFVRIAKRSETLYRAVLRGASGAGLGESRRREGSRDTGVFERSPLELRRPRRQSRKGILSGAAAWEPSSLRFARQRVLRVASSKAPRREDRGDVSHSRAPIWRSRNRLVDFAAGGRAIQTSVQWTTILRRSREENISLSVRRGADPVDIFARGAWASRKSELVRQTHSPVAPRVEGDADPEALRADLRRRGGGGVALDAGMRARLGRFVGFDPGAARLHLGSVAAEAARRLRAEAFTIGHDVFFGEGRYDPSSAPGIALIAHELTHVRQQTASLSAQVRYWTPQGGDSLEREAQRAAAAAQSAAGGDAGGASPGLPLQRETASPKPSMAFALPAPAPTSGMPEPSRTATEERGGKATPETQQPDARAVADRVYDLMRQEIIQGRRRGLQPARR